MLFCGWMVSCTKEDKLGDRNKVGRHSAVGEDELTKKPIVIALESLYLGI
jgi:hypothetical protein